MKIVIYQKAGRDYPAKLKNCEDFIEDCRKTITQRLELRPQDTIEFVEEDDRIKPLDAREGLAFLYRDSLKDAKKVFEDNYTCKLDIAPHSEDFEIAVIPMTFASGKWDNVQVCISQHPAIFMAAHLRLGEVKVLTIRTGSGTIPCLWDNLETMTKALELGVNWEEFLTDKAFKKVAHLINDGMIGIYSYDKDSRAVKEA